MSRLPVTPRGGTIILRVALIRCACAVVRLGWRISGLGWTVIRSQERRHGLLPMSSTEPAGAWLEEAW
jgi:hypothetical protein